MKTLYFLQRDFPDLANYAFVDSHDEMIREAFDTEVIPEFIFIKDGRPYYAGYEVLAINRLREFMVRYDEIKRDALPYLQAAPTAITIYPQYYLRSIGHKLRNFEYWLSTDGKRLWAKTFNDPELESYPHALIQRFQAVCFLPHFKQSAMNFLKIFVLPAVAVLVLFWWSGCCRAFCICCSCGFCCRGSKRDVEDGDELLMDQEVTGTETKKTK